jgi:hypothetical protein
VLIGDVGFLLDRCSYFEFSLALVSGFVIHNFNDTVSRIYHSPIFVCTTDTDQASAQPDPGLHFHASLHDPHFESATSPLFAHCWLVLFLSGYFFIAYPLQGWSHAVFHLVICFVPPMLMQAALALPSSQPYVQTAIHCSRVANGYDNI